MSLLMFRVLSMNEPFIIVSCLATIPSSEKDEYRYLVLSHHDYEGYDAPIGGFKSLIRAQEKVASLLKGDVYSCDAYHIYDLEKLKMVWSIAV